MKKTVYKLHVFTSTGAETIHTFNSHKEAVQLASEQSYFQSKIIRHEIQDSSGIKVAPSADPRVKSYLSRMKDCFGFYARNAALDIDKTAESLMADGFTHVENLFGPIRIRKWSKFVTGQRAAIASRVK
jgi:hypothetical protein